MEALKHAEHLVGVPHVKADAVIADEDHWLAVHGRLPYFNDAPFAWPGELEGVREQVDEDLLDQAWIAFHKWQRTTLQSICRSCASVRRCRITSSTSAFNPVISMVSAWRPTRARSKRSSTKRPMCCAVSCMRCKYSFAAGSICSPKSSKRILEKPLICRRGARRSCETE